jgi:uncharacterized protein YacL
VIVLTWAKLILKVLLFTVCIVGGYIIADGSFSEYRWAPWAGSVAGLLFAALALAIEKVIKDMPLKALFGGTIGLIIGLSVARLLGYGFIGLENNIIRVAVYVVLSCILGYIGMVLGSIKVDEIRVPNWSWLMRGGASRAEAPAKILDTSVIIDGRVVDIVETGFLGGVLVIPEFVLQELQHIADSPDPTRKVRGRRGLDIIKRLQQEKLVEIRIDRQDFDNLTEVDAKLIALALKLNAKIVTNDYNLAKVSEVQGIRVLNINQLANALKPVVLPGEVLRLQILKEGKEQGQGIAYLEDGTMVVVENASRFLGKEVEVAVTSILQTTAGRLIFTIIKDFEHTRHQH